MDNNSQVPVGGGQLPLQNESELPGEGVSDIGTSVPRRQFLKRSGAATAGTILAWHGTRVDVYAEESTSNWVLKMTNSAIIPYSGDKRQGVRVDTGPPFYENKNGPFFRYARKTTLDITGDWKDGLHEEQIVTGFDLDVEVYKQEHATDMDADDEDWGTDDSWPGYSAQFSRELTYEVDDEGSVDYWEDGLDDEDVEDGLTLGIHMDESTSSAVNVRISIKGGENVPPITSAMKATAGVSAVQEEEE